MECFQTDNLPNVRRSTPHVETSSELQKVAERMGSETGPNGYEEEGKIIEEKRRRKKERKEKMVRAIPALVEYLNEKVGEELLSPSDVVVSKVIGLSGPDDGVKLTTTNIEDEKFESWFINSRFGYFLRNTNALLADGNPLEDERVRIRRRALEEFRASKEGLHHMVDFDGEEFECRICGDPVNDGDHFEESDGVLECPKLADPPRRVRELAERVVARCEWRGRFRKMEENGKIKWVQ